MFRSLLFLYIIVASTAIPPTASGQNVAGASTTQKPPIIRSVSRLVNVSVVVTDPDGRPAQGLGKKDFQILENSEPEQIAFFSARDRDDEADGNYGAPPLARGVYSNDPQRLGTPRQGATIILFDTVNTPYLSQAYDLGRIRIFLRRQLQPHDRVGIYVLNENGLKVVYDPQQPAGALIGAMQRHDPQPGGSRAGQRSKNDTGLSELDRFLRGKDDSKPLIGNSMVGCEPRRFPITITAFQQIARSIAGLPGRKAIIWVADSTPLQFIAENGVDLAREERFCGVAYDPDLRLEDAANLRPLSGLPRPRSVGPKLEGVPPDRGLSENEQLDLLLRLLNQNNITLYPMRADGLRLRTVPLFGPHGMDSTAFVGEPDGVTESVLAAEEAVSADPLSEAETHEVMEALALRTGGRAYYDRDLETGIRRALDDAKYGYELAYYPDDNRWNGDWRQIQVKVNRPDVTVLARGGYYAFPEPKLLPAKASKQLLKEIAASPLEDTEIPFTVKLPPPGSVRSPAIEARVFVDPQSVFNNEPGDGWKSDYTVLFFQLTAKNKILDVTTESVGLKLTDAKYSKAVKEGFDTVGTLELKPGAAVLYVIVHNKRSDAVGSVRIPLDQCAPSLWRTNPPH